MKKNIAFLLIFVVLFLFVGCKSVDESNNDLPKDEENLAPKGEIMEYDKYNLETYLKPIWYTREVYNETVLFVGEEDETKLLYDKIEIISVRNYGLDIEYEEGKDYIFQDDKIKRLKDSEIPYFEIDEYYKTESDAITINVINEKTDFQLEGKRYLKYGEGDAFTSKQIAVTYKHDSSWKGKVPEGQEDKLINFNNKLKEKQEVNLLFYGDSITTGCNSSGTNMGGNVSPFADSYPIMIKKYLEQKYDTAINYTNTAVAGFSTSQGLNNFYNNVLKYKPDLLVLAFGMNDGTNSVDSYKKMISQMIDTIHLDNPNTEVILVGTTLPNYESDWYGNQEFYITALEDLTYEYDFVACADMTKMHKDLFNAGKRFRDVTANNINHPNDFVARLYSQVILKTMLGNEFSK
jgi:lysophospholipase L1-like esterase